jgi:hypothetical protein
MSSGQQWAAFLVYWVLAALAFGVFHVRWTRRQTAKGEKIPGPIFQFIFGVLLAPIALAAVAGLLWAVLRSL